MTKSLQFFFSGSVNVWTKWNYGQFGMTLSLSCCANFLCKSVQLQPFFWRGFHMSKPLQRKSGQNLFSHLGERCVTNFQLNSVTNLVKRSLSTNPTLATASFVPCFFGIQIKIGQRPRNFSQISNVSGIYL